MRLFKINNFKVKQEKKKLSKDFLSTLIIVLNKEL